MSRDEARAITNALRELLPPSVLALEDVAIAPAMGLGARSGSSTERQAVGRTSVESQRIRQETGGVAVTHKMRAVYDEDLDAYLDSLGIADDLAAGRLRCFRCGVPVSRESLGCLFPLDGQISVCCDGPQCLAEVPVEAVS